MNVEKVDVVIQARIGSTRLPGKVLLELKGKSLLERVVDRGRKITGVSDIIVATTNNPSDDIIVEFCQKNNFPVFRGSEEDVLNRYVQAARQFNSEVIVRGTSDNPFFDPEVARKLIDKHQEERNDYTFSSGFPLGSACEIFRSESLARANQLTTNPIHHEHIGTYFLDNDTNFRVGCLSAPKQLNFPKLRLTIDTPADFDTAQNILERLDDNFTITSVVELTQKEPQLLTNTEVQQVYPTEKIRLAFTGNNPLKKSCQ